MVMARIIVLTVSGLEIPGMTFYIQVDQNYQIKPYLDLNGHFFGQGRGGTKKMGKISQNRPKNMFLCPYGQKWKNLHSLRKILLSVK